MVFIAVELFTAKSEAFHSTHKMKITQCFELLHEGVYFHVECDWDTLDLSIRIRELRDSHFS